MKNLFENWRRFINEEETDDKSSRDDIKKAINAKLDKEGGAAGMDPLVAAAKEKDPDITEEEVKQIIAGMKNVAKHKKGDLIDKEGLQEAVAVYLEAKQIAEGALEEEEGKKDACYKKIKAAVKAKGGTWPSAYASGRLVQCRKVGAANYGNKSKSGK